ncbi:MAG: Trm112 family protein [Pseudomonadales bacterium]|nr:Trm112 family protein [Pseudomonadales bacterium]
MDIKLLEILVCPVTKAPLVYNRDLEELWCSASELAYPILDGIPVMLEDQARQLTSLELGKHEEPAAEVGNE